MAIYFGITDPADTNAEFNIRMELYNNLHMIISSFR